MKFWGTGRVGFCSGCCLKNSIEMFFPTTRKIVSYLDAQSQSPLPWACPSRENNQPRGPTRAGMLRCIRPELSLVCTGTAPPQSSWHRAGAVSAARALWPWWMLTALQREKNGIFNLIPRGLQQVELQRSCYLVGMGVRGRGGNLFELCSTCGWGKLPSHISCLPWELAGNGMFYR